MSRDESFKLPLQLISRNKERELFFKNFEKTSSFFIKGVVGVGKTSFISALIQSFESLGYTFYYTKVSPLTTASILLSHILEELKIVENLSYKSLPTFENTVERIREFLITKKVILCIDDFHWIDDEKAIFLLKTFKNACEISKMGSKLMVLSRKQIVPTDDISFLDAFILELGGLRREETEKFIRSFFDLHNYRDVSLEDIEKIALSVEYNPLLVKMALRLIIEKRFSLKDFLSKKILNQEDFIRFVYDNYLAYYDKDTIEFLEILSCFRGAIDIDLLHTVYPISSFQAILTHLKSDLLVQESSWGKIKLKNMFHDYYEVNLSPEKKKRYYSICLEYFKKASEDVQKLEFLNEIFRCYIILGKTEEAESILLENYHSLIEIGSHKQVLAMIAELEAIKPDIRIELKLAEAEIYYFITEKDSLDLIEKIEKKIPHVQCLDLLLLKISVLHRKLSLDSQALEYIDSLIRLIESLRDKEKSSTIVYYQDLDVLMAKTLYEKLSLNLSTYKQNNHEIREDFEIIESLLPKIKERRIRLSLEANLYNCKAKQAVNKGNRAEMLNLMQKAIAIGEELQNKNTIAWFYFTTARYLVHLEDYETVLEFLQKATELSEQYDYQYLLPLCYSLYGHYYYLQGEFEKALSFLYKGENNSHSSAETISVINNKIFIVSLLTYLERYEEAWLLLNDILKRFKSVIDRTPLLLINVTREQLFFAMKYDDTKTAKECTEIILANISKTQSVTEKVRLLNFMAHYYLYTKNYESALESVLNAKHENRGKTTLGEIEFILSRIYFETQEYSLALESIERSISCYKKLHMNYRLCWAQIFKAKMLYKFERYGEAKKGLFEALKISEKHNYIYWQASVKVLLASVYMHESKYDLCYSTILETLHKAIERSFYDISAISYQLLRYFFQYPLSEKVKKKVSQDLKIMSQDKINVLYEKYFEQASTRQKEFISLIKEPQFKSQHYYYHVVTADKAYDLQASEYHDFLKHGIKNYELFINIDKEEIFCREYGKLSLEKYDLFFRLIIYFIRKRGRVLSKEELITNIWHESYDPFIHDQLIYVTINRFRKFVGDDVKEKKFIFIRNVEHGYYFNEKSSFCFIEKKLVMDDRNLSYRQEWIIQFLVDNQKIANKDFVQYFKTSRTTAVQELDTLVSKKLLRKKGKGRSTYYLLRAA